LQRRCLLVTLRPFGGPGAAGLWLARLAAGGGGGSCQLLTWSWGSVVKLLLLLLLLLVILALTVRPFLLVASRKVQGTVLLPLVALVEFPGGKPLPTLGTHKATGARTGRWHSYCSHGHRFY
jgi:hypothetical protein